MCASTLLCVFTADSETLPSFLPSSYTQKKSLSLSLFLFSPSLPLLHFSTPSEDPLHSLSLFLPPFIFSSLSLLSLALPLPLPHLVSYLLCLPLLLSVDPLSLPVPSPQTPLPFSLPLPLPLGPYFPLTLSFSLFEWSCSFARQRRALLACQPHSAPHPHPASALPSSSSVCSSSLSSLSLSRLS